MGVVPSTDVSGDPIRTRSLPEVETDRHRTVELSCPITCGVTSREVDFDFFNGVSFVTSSSMYGRIRRQPRITFIVDDRISNLVCRVMFWTTVFTSPDVFVSVLWDGLRCERSTLSSSHSKDGDFF